jgi:hypothetical protein
VYGSSNWFGFGSNVWLSSEERSIRELIIYRQSVYAGSGNTNGLRANLHRGSRAGGFAHSESPYITRPTEPSEPGTPQRAVGWRETTHQPTRDRALGLDGSYPHCLRTLGPLLDIELNSLVFL